MAKRNIVISKSMIVALSAAQLIPAYAGTWSNPSADTWQYKDDNGNTVKGAWVTDAGHQFYVDENGIMVTAWKDIAGARYFFNTVHDGSFGASLKGWQWIDGYCYFFSPDGKLVRNGQTPDGYSVDTEGRWVENGNPVYVAGKGITSAATSVAKAADTVSVPSGAWVKGQAPNDSKWWFRKSDGSYPKDGWAWLDGNRDGVAECYYFDKDGWAQLGGTTPDGYSVNESGAWTVNGIIQTKRVSNSPLAGAVTTAKASTGGGGGGGGGGGSSSSSVKYYSYTVTYVDEKGNVLDTQTGNVKRNASVSIEKKAFDGYSFVSGPTGSAAVTEDDMSFVIRYKKNETAAPVKPMKDDTKQQDKEETKQEEQQGSTTDYKKDDEKTPGSDGQNEQQGGQSSEGSGNQQKPDDEDPVQEEKEEKLSYTILYLDQDGKKLKTVSGQGEKGESIDIETKTISGYTADAGNKYSFVLSEDGQTVNLHYTKVKAKYSYLIEYVSDGETLASISGTNEEGTEISVPVKRFDGYMQTSDQPDDFILNDDMVITIEYEKVKQATPSEAEAEKLSYYIRYIDKDSDAVILEESGQCEKGTKIVPKHKFEDYQYAADYEFTVDENEEMFAVYIVSTNEQEEVVETKYTIRCVDKDGVLLKTYSGTVMCGDDPVELTDELSVDGYTRTDTNRFFAQKYKNNTFEAEFEKNVGSYDYIVTMKDVDTGNVIGTKTFEGGIGDTINLQTIRVNGYKQVEGQKKEAVISAANNAVTLFYKKEATTPEVVKKADYVVHFCEQGNEEHLVMNDESGKAEVGELSYEFIEKFNDAQGNVWEAVNPSPTTFTVSEKGNNVFYIEYVNKGNISTEKAQVPYTIRYIAQDTGAVLGVKTGIQTEGNTVFLRNSWTPDYSFVEDTSTNVKITTDSEEFKKDIKLKRVTTRVPDEDEFSGKNKVREWSAIFIDSSSNYLLPAVTGYSVEGDMFYLDYPDTIIDGDVTYRAKVQGPLSEVVHGTATKHYIIRYITGEASESKLDEWENKAHQKANVIFNEEPARYFVTYREKNLDNDIGVEFAVGNIGDEVVINAYDFIGWETPMTSLGEFTLRKDNDDASAQYAYQAHTDGQGTYHDQTPKNIERIYTVHIQDEDGNDLAEAQTGHLWFESNSQTRAFQVYFPEMFTDENGVLWSTEEVSPKTAYFDTLSDTDVTVVYHKLADKNGREYVVEGSGDVNRILNNLVTRTGDAKSHEAIVIGKNYDPSKAEISSTSLNSRMADCGTEILDTFTIGNDTYTVVQFTYSRYWNEDNCTHEWHYKHDSAATCAASGTATAVCDRCGKEVTLTKPAAGHVDEDLDSVCDVCGTQLRKQLGDELVVTWTTGALADKVGFESKDYHFICVDEDYNGTGKMLYVSEEGIDSSVYGKYAAYDTNAVFDDSMLKYFLGDEFADGLSNKDNLELLNGQKVSLLSKSEYDTYKAAAENKYPFPDGLGLTRTSTETGVTLTNGTVVTAANANGYEAHPAFLMANSDETVGVGIRDNYKVGDLQLRKVGDEMLLFRCIDDSYKDATGTDKAQALFLCESIIPASAMLGYTGEGGTQDTRWFGENNNYRYSNIKAFLEGNTPDINSLAKVDIGIANEYSGSSERGTYEGFKANNFTAHKRSTAQKLYAKMFILSMEEAMAYKDYLWKFNGSASNNPDDVITEYARAYWLRTPEYGTTNRIYSVNLEDGKIEPRNVGPASGDADYCMVGIRPAYAIAQAREDGATSGR